MTDGRSPDRDLEEEHMQRVTEPRSRTFRTFRTLAEIPTKLYALLAVLVFAVVLVVDVELPRWLRVIGTTFVIVAPAAGRPVGKRVKEWLWSPNWVYLVDLDARETKGALYRWPEQQFRQIEVTEGSLDWLTSQFCVGRNVDFDAATPEECSVEGTWRGTMTDRELLLALSAVKECRGQLEADAKRGFAIESQAFTIVRNASRRAVRRIVDTFETGTLADEGDGLTAEIDAAIEEFGLERKAERLDDQDPAAQAEERTAEDVLDDLAPDDGVAPGGVSADD